MLLKSWKESSGKVSTLLLMNYNDMKRLLCIVVFSLAGLTVFSQGGNNKFFVGFSGSLSRDDLRNNSLLTGYVFTDNSYDKGFEILGEIGFNISTKGSLGADIGYYSSSSVRVEDALLNKHYDGKISGFVLAPKYRVSKSYLGKIELFTDFKFQLHYLVHENVIPTLYDDVILDDYLNGTEFRYGISINPGLILNLGKTLSVKLDYPVANLYHSTIKEADDSTLHFDTINCWEYEFAMSLSDLRLGVVFRF